MASSIVASSHSDHRDGLDAARALLGVSPKTATSFPEASTQLESRKRVTFPLEHRIYINPQESRQDRTITSPAPKAVIPLSAALREFNPPSTGGLDALAFLASREQASLMSAQNSNPRYDQSNASSSSDDDSDSMPPPPPRLVARRRSMSNPEGMEKWDSLCESRSIRFVLPTSIIEEELAVCNAAIDEKAALAKASKEAASEEATQLLPPIEEQEPDDSHLSPEELLRKARSRLLEDLSESNISGDKGVLTLPHSLAKYKHVYNQNGRIGIYTPAERAAIISRFNRKRSKRVWNKKIRYNCRKNLADRRMRVKGRFVKRSAQLSFPISEASTAGPTVDPIPKEKQDENAEDDMQTDMPDTSDPEAGFCPTEDQPYRRLRRHTIT